MSQNFSLSSPDIQEGASIDARFEFNDFGCGGENRERGQHPHRRAVNLQGVLKPEAEGRRLPVDRG